MLRLPVGLRWQVLDKLWEEFEQHLPGSCELQCKRFCSGYTQRACSLLLVSRLYSCVVSVDCRCQVGLGMIAVSVDIVGLLRVDYREGRKVFILENLRPQT